MSPRFLRTFLAAALFPLAFAAYAADAPPPERAKMMFRDWPLEGVYAGGNNADIRLTPRSIIYKGRMTYALRYLREVATDKIYPDWHTRDFSLFEVISPPPAEDADLDDLICYDRDSIGPYPLCATSPSVRHSGRTRSN